MTNGLYLDSSSSSRLRGKPGIGVGFFPSFFACTKENIRHVRRDSNNTQGKGKPQREMSYSFHVGPRVHAHGKEVGLVLFALAGFSLDASLEPQPRTQK